MQSLVSMATITTTTSTTATKITTTTTTKTTTTTTTTTTTAITTSKTKTTITTITTTTTTTTTTTSKTKTTSTTTTSKTKSTTIKWGFDKKEFEQPGAMKIAVIGGGMVGQRMVEKLLEYGGDKLEISLYAEEVYNPYDRVNLTKYFNTRDPADLEFQPTQWYKDNNVNLVTGDKVESVDTEGKTFTTASGFKVSYDKIILATGSYAWVPPIKGKDSTGVFVYRTIRDLENIYTYIKEQGVKKGVVIGGGLLGLEAAKVLEGCGIDTTVIDHGPVLMGRQLDMTGGKILVREIEKIATVLTSTATKQIECDDTGRLCGISFSKPEGLEPRTCKIMIIATGIRPRDELARTIKSIEVHPRGGIVVDDQFHTTAKDIYAVGECALHRGRIYGLIAPCYAMVEVLAKEITGKDPKAIWEQGDMSTKLKLMGVDVATFGEYQTTEKDKEGFQSLSYHDPFEGVYRRLFFNLKGTQLLGGMLVGDASDYNQMAMLAKSTKPLKVSPSDLILPPSKAGAGAVQLGVEDMDDDAQICSCNDVSKGDICTAIADGCCTVKKLGMCTKAGSGCGGCKPMVKKILNHQLQQLGVEVNNYVCEHFKYSRAEIYHIAKVKKIKSYEELYLSHGIGGNPDGCEICKPTAASIFASLWNEHILQSKHRVIQETNDQFLANIQRGGTYSVIPRVPGGEITPERLIVLGEVAKKYSLYTKITGGQRVDLLGAPKSLLPSIWKDLIDAGFESGHAYGKALRTVKSCVGSTWCRYGMRDSTGFAIQLEKRYRGIRSPHKLKGGVSGCVRECAEAQGKDFGLIATSDGYNIYVCGNGGSRPKHALLLISGVQEADCIKYLDRFLMFYISTADKLQRTARWMEALEGGMDYLKEVIIEDKLGIAEELEKQMSFLVNTYKCEWTEVVNDPAKQQIFRDYVGKSIPQLSGMDKDISSSKKGHIKISLEQQGIEFIPQRDQQRPVNWPKMQEAYPKIPTLEVKTTDARWIEVAQVSDVPLNGGVTVKYGNVQIAVYNFHSRGQWYAVQNMCPHRNALVLSSGLIGDMNGIPKVACPLHKKPFNLESGEALDGTDFSLIVFPIQIVESHIELYLPSTSELDAVLGSEDLVVKAEHDNCASACGDEKLAW